MADMSEIYRFPDLPPLVIEPAAVEKIRAALPELPDAKRARFESQYNLPRYDAELLVADQAVADYFEAVVRSQPSEIRNAKTAANWITGELFRLMNETGDDLAGVKLTPERLASLTGLVAGGAINVNTAKIVFEEMYHSGRAPEVIVEEKGLAQVSDAAAIEAIVAEVLHDNPEQVAAYLGGKAAVEQWFFGQAMRQLKGQGNPQVIRQALAEQLEQLKRKT